MGALPQHQREPVGLQLVRHGVGPAPPECQNTKNALGHVSIVDGKQPRKMTSLLSSINHVLCIKSSSRPYKQCVGSYQWCSNCNLPLPRMKYQSTASTQPFPSPERAVLLSVKGV